MIDQMKGRKHCGNKYMWKKRWVGMGLFGILFVAFIFKFLWNALIPELFGGPIITYWQAFGLLVLSKILFGGIGGGCHHHRCGKHGRWREHFQDRIKQKMEKMSPEDRKKFKEGFMGKGWDVNVWEVDEEEEKGEEDKKDGGDKKEE